MKRIYRSTLLACLAVAALLTAPALATRTSITLGTNPEPPATLANPGGTVSIFWTVVNDSTSTPALVTYRLKDPLGVVIEQQDYTGTSGMAVTRDWTVPEGALPGTYQVRVEFSSAEYGIEATAQVVFWVADPAVPEEKITWGWIKSLFGLDS